MIIAFTKINKNEDVLIRKEEEQFKVEYRINLNTITNEKFRNYVSAEIFYSKWVSGLMKDRGDDYN